METSWVKQRTSNAENADINKIWSLIYVLEHVFGRSMLWRTASLRGITTFFVKSSVHSRAGRRICDGTYGIIWACIPMVETVSEAFWHVLNNYMVIRYNILSQKLNAYFRYLNLILDFRLERLDHTSTKMFTRNKLKDDDQVPRKIWTHYLSYVCTSWRGLRMVWMSSVVLWPLRKISMVKWYYRRSQQLGYGSMEMS